MGKRRGILFRSSAKRRARLTALDYLRALRFAKILLVEESSRMIQEEKKKKKYIYIYIHICT